MPDLPSWLYAGLVVYIGIHLLLSVIHWENHWYLRKANKKHYTFLLGIVSKDEGDKKRSDDASVWLGARAPEIKRRILKMGMKDNYHPHVEPAGYGQLLTANISVLDNLLQNNQAIQEKARRLLSDAQGYSAVTARRHLHPIYWLETLIFLPKALASGLGLDDGKSTTIVNIVQATYTLLLIVVALKEIGLIDWTQEVQK